MPIPELSANSQSPGYREKVTKVQNDQDTILETHARNYNSSEWNANDCVCASIIAKLAYSNIGKCANMLIACLLWRLLLFKDMSVKVYGWIKVESWIIPFL